MALRSMRLALGHAFGAAVLLTPSVARAAPCTPGDSGAYRIHKLQQPVGWERWRCTVRADSVVLATTWALDYLGSPVTLDGALTWDAGNRPVRLVLRGATSTMTPIDLEIVRTGVGSGATIRLDSARRTLTWDTTAYPLAHYPPFALEEALYRHWVRVGRPHEVPLVPEGAVRFTRRGRDTVRLGDRPVPLDRYTVTGLVWGAQTAWFDAEGRLIAAVSGDAELDRMQAVRAGFEPVLALVIERSVADGLEDQARIARAIRPLHAGHYALVGARVIDGSSAPPLDSATIIVRGGRIEAVGAARQVRVPAGVPRVNVAGRTIIPGLWDMHVHYEQAEWPLVSLASGVTTARDMGNEFALAVALRDALARGRLLGPRLLLAGVIDGGAHPLGVVTVATPAEARSAVQRYARAGFQQIKVYQSVPPALVSVIAAEAHRLGMTVTGHVPTGMGARAFLEAGADQLTHWNFVLSLLRAPGENGRPGLLELDGTYARAAIAWLAARGTVVEPSLARAEQHAHPRDSGYAAYEPGVDRVPLPLRAVLNSTGVSATMAARTAATRRIWLAMIGALHRGGVPIVLGTDLAVPGHSIYRELELAVAAGLTPLQALRAATAVPAHAMGLSGESGTITAGKRADLVVLDGDPLGDIRRVRTVRWVVRDGRVYDSAALWRAAGFVP